MGGGYRFGQPWTPDVAAVAQQTRDTLHVVVAAVMPSHCTRVALVGLGDAGRHHARALQAFTDSRRAQLSAVCARDAGRLAATCRDLGIADRVQTFPDLGALLAADVCDAVILATPDGLHADQIVQCARAGRHVLVEKPLALHPADAARAVAAAHAQGIVLRVGYHLRHHAGHAALHARRHDLIGPLRSMYIRWAWPDPATAGWRARGEQARFWSLAALGTHAIDLACWFAAAPVQDVVALTEPPLHAGIDRAAEVTLRFPGGTLAHVSVAVTHRAVSRVLLCGDHGELEATGTLGARGDGEILLRRPRTAPQPLSFVAHDPYVAQLQSFLAAIDDHAAPPDRDHTPVIEDLLSNVDVLERIAAAQGSPPHAST